MSDTSQANTSQAKIDANRANAQKSTGPKSPEGRAKVAQNGTKHGFASRRPLISLEEFDEYSAFWTGLMQSFNPKGGAEMQFFDQMLDAAWALRRIAKNEVQLHIRAGGVDPMISPDPDICRQEAGLMRYKVDHTRIYNRAYDKFTKLQNHRLTREAMEATAPPGEKTDQSQTATVAEAEKFMAFLDEEIAATKMDISKVLQTLANTPKDLPKG